MVYYIERLNHEIKNIMKFWHQYAFDKGKIACEVSNDGIVKDDAPCGSVYISRILFGASTAMIHLQDDSYHNLADVAFFTLTNRLKNPVGGYYWAVNTEGQQIRDEVNVSFAQGFALYGLVHYYLFSKKAEVLQLAAEQYELIRSKIYNPKMKGYSDGYLADWSHAKDQSFSLGTHLHILEAFCAFYRVIRDDGVKRNIAELIEIILQKFMHCADAEILHRLDSEWNALPNENWIGHNLETSWIIYRAATLTGEERIVDACRNASVHFAEKAIEMAFDKNYGGMFNRFSDNKLLISDKEWWPQAESVIAFFQVYSITGDKKYLSFAVRLLEYIDNTFSDNHYGEWYDSVTREGMPIYDRPKIHLWKSMYHNIRYCIESAAYLQKLFQPAAKTDFSVS